MPPSNRRPRVTRAPRPTARSTQASCAGEGDARSAASISITLGVYCRRRRKALIFGSPVQGKCGVASRQVSTTASGAAMEFQLVEKLRDNIPVLEVAGDVDVHTAPQLRDRLNKLIDETDGDIVVDLTGTGFIDSTGLGVLVGARKRLAGRDDTRVIRLLSTQ